jgi:hypothetical protein
MAALNRMILRSLKLALVLLAALAAPLLPGTNLLLAQDEPQASSANITARPVGTIKSIDGNTLILTTDAGAEVTILVQAAAQLVSIAPGQKDLQSATAIQLQDLRPGDRILVRGLVGVDGKSVLAKSVVAIKKADIADKRTQDREEWQKNGIGGLVSAVDPASGTLTLGIASPAGPKDLAIHVSKTTIVRRYAPDSVQFDKATLSSLDQIKPGDQLRARGSPTAGGNDFSANEIVSGSFRNIAGMVSSVDPANNSLTVEDLVTKKSILIRITPESQVRKLPPPMAQRIALRLKGISPNDASAGTGSRLGARPANLPAQSAATGNTVPASGPGGFGRNGGTPDLQQMILRMPPSTLADFQKGDVVMVVATEGDCDAQATAITLLCGVEPILATFPKGEAGSLLSPWSLSNGGGVGDGATP